MWCLFLFAEYGLWQGSADTRTGEEWCEVRYLPVRISAPFAGENSMLYFSHVNSKVFLFSRVTVFSSHTFHRSKFAFSSFLGKLQDFQVLLFRFLFIILIVNLATSS